MAVLEAAALSIPCITSEATNINTYIRKYSAGIALPNNTAQAIASAMHSFYEFNQEHQLSFLGENARIMVATSFNWAQIAQQLINAYAA